MASYCRIQRYGTLRGGYRNEVSLPSILAHLSFLCRLGVVSLSLEVEYSAQHVGHRMSRGHVRAWDEIILRFHERGLDFQGQGMPMLMVPG